MRHKVVGLYFRILSKRTFKPPCIKQHPTVGQYHTSCIVFMQRRKSGIKTVDMSLFRSKKTRRTGMRAFFKGTTGKMSLLLRIPQIQARHDNKIGADIARKIPCSRCNGTAGGKYTLITGFPLVLFKIPGKRY